MARGKHSVLCECPGPQTDRVTAHLRPISTSLAAPRFPFTCAPPGQAVGRCVFSAAQPGPLRRHRRDKGRGSLVPARSGLPVYRGEGGGGHLRSSAVRFTFAQNLPEGCWGPGARSPEQPGEGEGRGQSCCGRGKQQVRKVCNLATPAGNSTKGARGSSLHGLRPREGLLTLPQELQEPRNGFKRGSPWRPLERKLDNRRGQPGGRWSTAWVVAQELIKRDFFKPPSVEAASWKCRKRALGKHTGEQQTPTERTKATRSPLASRSPGPGAPPGGGADNKAGSLQARKLAPPRPRPRGLGAGAFVGEQPGSLGIPVKQASS